MATTAKKKTTQKKSTTKKHKPAKKADTVKVKKVGAGEFRSAISLIREQRVAKAFPKYLQRRVKIDYNWHIKHPEFLDVGQKKRKTA